MHGSSSQQSTFEMRMTAGGRMVVPATVRREMGVSDGDTLIGRLADGELRVTTVDGAIARAQTLVAKYIPPGVSLVDELIAERREEARREWGYEGG